MQSKAGTSIITKPSKSKPFLLLLRSGRDITPFSGSCDVTGNVLQSSLKPSKMKREGIQILVENFREDPL